MLRAGPPRRAAPAHPSASEARQRLRIELPQPNSPARSVLGPGAGFVRSPPASVSRQVLDRLSKKQALVAQKLQSGDDAVKKYNEFALGLFRTPGAIDPSSFSQAEAEQAFRVHLPSLILRRDLIRYPRCQGRRGRNSSSAMGVGREGIVLANEEKYQEFVQGLNSEQQDKFKDLQFYHIDGFGLFVQLATLHSGTDVDMSYLAINPSSQAPTLTIRKEMFPLYVDTGMGWAFEQLLQAGKLFRGESIVKNWELYLLMKGENLALLPVVKDDPLGVLGSFTTFDLALFTSLRPETRSMLLTDKLVIRRGAPYDILTQPFIMDNKDIGGIHVNALIPPELLGISSGCSAFIYSRNKTAAEGLARLAKEALGKFTADPALDVDIFSWAGSKKSSPPVAPQSS